MGPKSSTQIKKEEITALQEKTHFDEMELKQIWKHFARISSSKTVDGVIDKEEFKEALGLTGSDAIADRIFSVFDENGDGFINAQEFVCGLSFFSKKATFDEKLHFAFNIYDIDKNGHIDKSELLHILKASLFENTLSLTEEQMKQAVDATFAEADLDGDGLISFEEFREMVLKHPQMIDSMTISTDFASSS
ncbi:putative serine/threonine-protein phosphatase 2B regulatory subunit [Monocercomonoides exilis]|uniref:putative serine/threonine-protein phosphatase 2B regulatory subunit n=1 Tax=Monocercomonoides exilis TaxID=2049356 RepID=UPI00355AAFF7|nr:putative serine/threonine-protein phosphatase 2B regulatory subunit [Monocercomonoides exilis]